MVGKFYSFCIPKVDPSRHVVAFTKHIFRLLFINYLISWIYHLKFYLDRARRVNIVGKNARVM